MTHLSTTELLLASSCAARKLVQARVAELDAQVEWLVRVNERFIHTLSSPYGGNGND